MQTSSALESSSWTRRVRVGIALAISLALHCGVAYAVMHAASVYGRATVPIPSMSIEEVQTVVLETIIPTDSPEPPSDSAAQQASVAAPEPTPDKHTPETQIEKTEKPAATEPVREAANQPPPPPPVPDVPAQTTPTDAAPAEVTPEPSVAAPPLVTIDRPDAIEVPVPKPDPEAVIEEQRRQAEEQKRKEEEAQRQAALEQRQREMEQQAKRQAELEQRKRELEQEAQRQREQERRKNEREAAEKREAEEAQRKRKAAQQAREAKKAKGAERNQRASPASRGKARNTRGAARSTASRGDVRAYAALVQARVAANRPSASSSGGRVVVSFGVSGSGRLTYARVVRSSGHSSLDQAALAAVRRSGPFPPPPGGHPESFSFPFTFN